MTNVNPLGIKITTRAVRRGTIAHDAQTRSVSTHLSAGSTYADRPKCVDYFAPVRPQDGDGYHRSNGIRRRPDARALASHGILQVPQEDRH